MTNHDMQRWTHGLPHDIPHEHLVWRLTPLGQADIRCTRCTQQWYNKTMTRSMTLIMAREHEHVRQYPLRYHRMVWPEGHWVGDPL